VSLAVGLIVLAVAVLLGGVAAVWQNHGQRVVPGIGAFATVAAAAVAVLHLLPEAIVEGGFGTLVALAAALLVPVVIERRLHSGGASATAPLLAGYVAVIVHQAGEGTAIATLARTHQLTTTIIIAIAAHTVPLTMIVAIRAMTNGGGAMRAGLALAGCALATIIGAVSLDMIGASTLETVKPWLVAAVAGLLLHALLHGSKRTEEELRHRVTDAVAGLVGLFVVVASLEPDGWLRLVSWPLRIVGLMVLAAGVVARGFVRTGRSAVGDGAG
jgi:hypothetical protein